MESLRIITKMILEGYDSNLLSSSNHNPVTGNFVILPKIEGITNSSEKESVITKSIAIEPIEF